MSDNTISNNNHAENNSVNVNMQSMQNILLSAESSSHELTKELSAHSVKHLESESAKKILSETLEELRAELTFLLDKCGFYYRLNARIKSTQSLHKKLLAVDEDGNFKYTPEHKLQDLFGFRIMLYFIEDMPIMKHLFKRHFEVADDWTKLNIRPEEFHALSVNGVFRLSPELTEKIQDLIKDKYIDNTFEIQLRTITFEGWHEIEHDYNYKINRMWKDQGEYLRRFHSVLAALELCDDTMVTSLENLAYDIYAKKRHPARFQDNDEIYALDNNIYSKRYNLCDWDRLIRSHFRLRFTHADNPAYPDQELDKSLSDIFDSEPLSDGAEAYKFAKYVLRFQKDILVRLLDNPKKCLEQARKASTNYSATDTPLWKNYTFKNKIPINVNSVIVLILLYKDAKESSLSESQRKLLTKQSVMQHVTSVSINNIFSIIDEQATIFSLDEKYEITDGWNTVHKNDIMLTTHYTESEWKDVFTQVIIADIKELLKNKIYVLPDDNIILSALANTGFYQSDNLMSDQNKAFLFSIKYDGNNIIYAIKYPGLYKEHNYWRQIAEFIPMNDVYVDGAKGMNIAMRLCIQYYYNHSEDSIMVPAITVPNIIKTLNRLTNNMAYPVKPLIGQKKTPMLNKHFIDIAYLKRVINKNTDNASIEIPIGLKYAIINKNLIHPILLFIFNSTEELYRYDAKLAIFENSLGNIAYIYAGIIEDESSDVFTKLYNKNANPLDDFVAFDFAEFNFAGIDGSGIYIFSKIITSDSDTSIPTPYIYKIPLDIIKHYDFNNESVVTKNRSETLFGFDGIIETLRNELMAYNLHIRNQSTDILISRFDELLNQ